jgi:hypothetical protein
VIWLVLLALAAPPEKTSLRFEVTIARGLSAKPVSGRVLVVLAPTSTTAPYRRIGATGMKAPPVIGADADRLAPGKAVVLDESCLLFPLPKLSYLPPGEYNVQALLDHSRDIRLPGAEGNFISKPQRVKLDPAKGGTVRLELTQAIPERKDKEYRNVKWIKLRSEKLSAFHGRPIYLRAGLAFPEGYDKDRERKYPLRVHIGGFGSRYTGALRLVPSDAKAPKFLHLHLDGAGPLGDPYQVNSANNGPYGDAITQELIPYVEKNYRGIGKPWARVLDGASTGGWVSLALQVFYPDFFNGAWSHCADPVDFRDFELVDIYKDENAYVNAAGFERPSMRDLRGDVKFTLRHECHLERVVGRGGKWALSGRDWASWNATFGPRGKDGLPVPLWDGATGKINRSVVEHWKKYDLRLHLETNWKTLGPKLKGKLHIWTGDADEYYLNNAMHRLEDFLKKAKPAYGGSITFGARKGHNWRGLTTAKMLEEMSAAVEAGRKAARE